MTSYNEVLVSKLDKHTILAEKFSIDTDTIVKKETIVSGPFRLVIKDQVVQVVAVVTESMYNGFKDKDIEVPCYKFQGNGWCPEAVAGDFLLQDIDNLGDIWAIAPEMFHQPGQWEGTILDDGRVVYGKPNDKPMLVIEIPEGMIVDSMEGPREAPAGCLLAMTNPAVGDFYVWTPDVIEKYVRDFITN